MDPLLWACACDGLNSKSICCKHLQNTPSFFSESVHMVSAVQNLAFDSLQSIRAREMGGARGENEKLRPATPPSSYTHTLLIPPCKKKGGGIFSCWFFFCALDFCSSKQTGLLDEEKITLWISWGSFWKKQKCSFRKENLLCA